MRILVAAKLTNEEAETKAIEKWLRMVDKPLAAKEEDRKDADAGP